MQIQFRVSEIREQFSDYMLPDYSRKPIKVVVLTQFKDKAFVIGENLSRVELFILDPTQALEFSFGDTVVADFNKAEDQ